MSETFDSWMFGGKALTYAYHFGDGQANGARKTVQYQSSSAYQAQYDYDLAAGRLATVTGGGVAFGYSYVANSSLVGTVTYGGFSRDNGYAPTSARLASQTYKQGSAILSERQISYWSDGRKQTDKARGDAYVQLGYANGVAMDFHYNSSDANLDPKPGIDRDELAASAKFPLLAGSWAVGSVPASGSARNWQHDAIGNRTEDQAGAYAVNALNQYTDVPHNAGTLAYDLDGNPTSDGARSYKYDVENRIVEMTVAGTTWTYKYDYLGRRIQRSVGGTTTRFVYDGWNLIAETDSSGNVARSYVWGSDASGSLQGAGGVGGLLMVKDGSSIYYPEYDSSLNVVALRASSGALAAAYDYDAFGNVTFSAGFYAKSNPIRFSTKYADDETSAATGPRRGLVYYGLRYYDPESGRFVNRDPIAEAGGANLYGFVTNNPVNRWDYLGMNPFSWLGSLFGGGDSSDSVDNTEVIELDPVESMTIEETRASGAWAHRENGRNHDPVSAYGQEQAMWDAARGDRIREGNTNGRDPWVITLGFGGTGGAVVVNQLAFSLTGTMTFDLRDPFNMQKARMGALLNVTPLTGVETDIGASFGVTGFLSSADNAGQLTGRGFAMGGGVGLPVGVDGKLLVDVTPSTPYTVSASIEATASISPLDVVPAQASWTFGGDANLKESIDRIKTAGRIVGRVASYAWELYTGD